jgi:RNA-directed DNA polymerase
VSAELPTWTVGDTTPEQERLIEQMIGRSNMMAAYKQVTGNKGAPGIDGMTVADLKSFIQANWETIKSKLVSGTYQPQAVRVVEIPKPTGGYRQLGIPTVVDRLIQQAVYQVLSPMFDPEFSEHSYGFRAGRSAHGAVRKAQEYQQQGKRWVVDIDLAKFFDEVNHDVLMARIKRKVKDKRMLKLIASFLRSGIMVGGIISQREKGTPQGSPLSPLLSNIMLDDLDKELESRGHSFCRYADDCNIYVGSRKAGERVMESTTRFIQKKLKLKVNREKSAVDRASNRTFLGYSYTIEKAVRIRVPKERVQRFKQKAKKLFQSGVGRNVARFITEDLNPVLRGWIQYYRLAEVKEFAQKLDQWIRRRLRLIIWQQWKRPYTRFRNLLKVGLPEDRARQSAFNGLGGWFNSGAGHMNQAVRKVYFDKLGLVSLWEMLGTA